MICHVPRLTYIGKFSPSTIAATNNTIATAVLIHLLNFVYLRKNPSTTASNMNNMEVVATAPFAATFVTTPASLVANPLKVPATTSAMLRRPGYRTASKTEEIISFLIYQYILQ